jgi:uncharacterized peroxidase-related enzyme
MAYIELHNDFPGIRGLMAFRPECARPLNELAEALLCAESTLTRGERELIATYVSHLNDCFFCQQAHGGIAQHLLACSTDYIDQVKADFNQTDLSQKMKALLTIAASVQHSGKSVTQDQIDTAIAEGATEREIHDTVLIAASFCMFNRYVDGLGTWAPQDRNFYIQRGKQRADEGYAHYNPAH